MDVVINAWKSVQLQIEGKRELSRDVFLPLPEYCSFVDKRIFFDEQGNAIFCKIRKVPSVERAKAGFAKMHKSDNAKVFIHKVWEMDEYGMDCKPTGKKVYHVDYAVRGYLI